MNGLVIIGGNKDNMHSPNSCNQHHLVTSVAKCPLDISSKLFTAYDFFNQVLKMYECVTLGFCCLVEVDSL